MYFSSLHGHGESSPGAPTVCRQGTNVPVVAEDVERALAHAGHDPHRDRDVGRVGELDADLGDRRAERAHRERHDVQRAAAHRAAELLAQHLAHLAGVAPVVRRSGVLLAGRADERAVLHAGHVARIRAARGRSSGAWRPRAARRCRRRRAAARARRTPRPSRRTSGPRRARSARRTPRPNRGVSGWSSGRSSRWSWRHIVTPERLRRVRSAHTSGWVAAAGPRRWAP